MSATKKSVTRKQQSRDFYENESFSNDFQDKSSSTAENSHSTSDVNLIRTRAFDQEQPAKSSFLGITSTKGLVIAGIVLLVVAAIIVVPTVLAVVLTRNPTVTVNTTTSAPNTTARIIYWNFDNNANDLYGIYNGTLLNGATYSNNTYFGFGYNLNLNNTANQTVIISSPFLSLAYSSFTLEAWIFGYTLTGDNSIFSQCACSSCQDQCLFLIVRNFRLYMGFMLDDLVGTVTLSANTWYHVAFVYDYSSRTQLLYVQGVLDSSKSSSGPYIGQNGSIFIGSSQLSGGSFHGLIDNVVLTTRAKSAAELLTAATLVAYFSFDGSSLTEDMGPNKMNGTSLNTAVITGKIGQGLVFNGGSSYFSVYGFYQLGRSNQPFTIALWLYPFSIAGGTIIHKSVFQITSSTWCQCLMGLTTAGQIAIRTNGANTQITGPFLTTLQWTHVVYTYSSTNGPSLYVNGALYLTGGTGSFSSSGTIEWLTFGYNFGICTPTPQTGGYYFGAMDEIYVFRRELSASEIYALANP